MDFTDPSTPVIGALVGTGIIGLLITLGSVALAFVLSAFFTALWVRLILVFMRKSLDREYGRMRMAAHGYEPGRASLAPAGPSTSPLRNSDGPRDW